MKKIRREDRAMKIPALLHLSRLGYEWMPNRRDYRDRETNIDPGTLREALERINGKSMPPEGMEALMADIREQLNRPDLGRGFYGMLREGWQGWRLLDAERPERNRFQMTSEMICAHGGSRFRPDITLFVNGLPLAMIEVKAGDGSGGIREEYDRMRKRFRNPDFRRFLQCAQIWAFSDDHPNSGERLLPTEGTFCATGARGDFPIYPFREKHPTVRERLGPLRDEAREEILKAHGLEDGPGRRSLRRRCAPGRELHRMMTGLFLPERFLFLLRYGILYGTEEDEKGYPRVTKRLLTSEQFFALWDLRRKTERGFRNLNLFAGGAAGAEALHAALIRLLRDLRPGAEMIRVLPEGASLPGVRREMRAYGAECDGQPAEGDVRLLSAAEMRRKAGDRTEAAGEGPARIYLLSGARPAAPEEERLRRRLRRRDPSATVITVRSQVAPAGGNYVYLLECADGSLYCGWTNHLEQRIRTHNEGRGAKYTRSRRPVKLVYSEEYASREEAMRREWQVKQLSRARKEALILSRREDLTGPGRRETTFPDGGEPAPSGRDPRPRSGGKTEEEDPGNPGTDEKRGNIP